MKAIARKKSFENYKKPINRSGYRIARQTVVASPSQSNNVFLQRKLVCPCDGGCPRCLNGLPIQTKRTIGQPGDKYEQEADRVADEVMRMPDNGAVGRQKYETSQMKTPDPLFQCPSCTDKDRGGQAIQVEPLIDQMTPLVQDQSDAVRKLPQPKENQRKTPEVTSNLESSIQSLKGTGQPLPETMQSSFGSRFGYDFSDVRIHTNARAGKAANTINASAFTVGKDVVFGARQYNPMTFTGKRLLAHELAHVVQQHSDQRQIVMRSCNCEDFPGGRSPTARETTTLEGVFPRLVRGDYCITGEADPSYNCYAWSIGITRRVVEREIDPNADRSVSNDEADYFYCRHNKIPVIGSVVAEVLTYGSPNNIQHAARRSRYFCDGTIMYESKLGYGNTQRIAHKADQLEGGVYGTLTPRSYNTRPPTFLHRPCSR